VPEIPRHGDDPRRGPQGRSRRVTVFSRARRRPGRRLRRHEGARVRRSSASCAGERIDTVDARTTTFAPAPQPGQVQRVSIVDDGER
jgi:hypothetical protein